MPEHFLNLATTPAVVAAQARYYGAASKTPGIAGGRDQLGEGERAFIAARDSFYIASVSESGWPYLQHRGGPAGFLKVLGPAMLGFADYRGNRQLLTTGNVNAHDRVSLFLMDYPQRSRLKILGHARVMAAGENPAWAEAVRTPGQTQAVERLFVIELVAFDWNCPQFITPRYTKPEVDAFTATLQTRIAELEARLANGS